MKLLEVPVPAKRLDLSWKTRESEITHFKSPDSWDSELSNLEERQTSEDESHVLNIGVVGNTQSLPLKGVDVGWLHDGAYKWDSFQVESECRFVFIVEVQELKFGRILSLENVEVHVEEHADRGAQGEAVVRSWAGDPGTRAVRSLEWKSDNLHWASRAKYPREKEN